MTLKRLAACIFVVAMAVSFLASGQLRLAELAPGGDDDDVVVTGNLEIVGVLASHASCAVPEGRTLRRAPPQPLLRAGRHVSADVFRPPIEAAV